MTFKEFACKRSITLLAACSALCISHIGWAQSDAPAPRAANALSERLDYGDALLNDGRVTLRVYVEPASDGESRVMLGQQTRLFVEILTDTWFSTAPRYPELSIGGAIILPPEQLGTNFTEQINGTTHSGQRRGYVIYPQRIGQLVVPSFEISLAIATEGRSSAPLALRTPAQRIEVIAPPDVETLTGFFTTPRLEVHDTWDKPLEDLEVGFAIKRTVRLSGEQMLGMLLPKLVFEAPEGIAVYADAPRVHDRINRGQYRGERRQTVTYVLQEPGTYELAPVELQWWDPVQEELRSATLSTPEFHVTGEGLATAQDLDDAGAAARWLQFGSAAVAWLAAHWLGLLTLVLIAVAAARGLMFAGPRITRAISYSRQQHQDSEATAFRNLKHSVSRGDEGQVIESYWLWRHRLAATTPGAADFFEDERRAASDRPSSLRRFEILRYAPEKNVDAEEDTPQFDRVMRTEILLELVQLRARVFSRIKRRQRSTSPAAYGLNP
ncbi:MAG: hypothetical protein ACI9QQ_001995 [Myxococcota bacterium]|jgi:hypothetical protein